MPQRISKIVLASFLALCFMASLPHSFAQGAAGNADEAATLFLTSTSITEDGRLLTATAANRSPNKPRGQNESPQVSFEPVEGATVYAICMFDTTANWLHFLVLDVTETSLPQGAYTDKKHYVGPYPPKGTGDHSYCIEVFALKAPPDKAAYKMNAKNTYQKIVDSLDIADGQPGNILQRDQITGLYKYGDQTE